MQHTSDQGNRQQEVEQVNTQGEGGEGRERAEVATSGGGRLLEAAQVTHKFELDKIAMRFEMI